MGKIKSWDSQPLGKMLDGKLAAKLGVSRQRVSQARIERGIPRFIPLDVRAYDGELGTVSDGAISRKHEIPLGTVSGRRVRLGIPAFRGFRWEDVDLREMAKTMTDGAIGKRFGVVLSAVRNARVRLGIPSSFPARRLGIDWNSEPLGLVSDWSLAKKHRCSRATVRNARRVRGIPVFTKEAAASESFATQSKYKSRKRRKNGRDSHHGEREKEQEENEDEGSWGERG